MNMPYWILFAFALLLSNCTTTPKSKGPVTDVGLWQGKVLMTSATTKRNKWASVVWASDSINDRMKINVSAVFDYPVATFLKKGDRHDLWLFTEKTHFISNDGKRLFYNLVKISLDPKIFYSLLGQPQSPGPGWQCQLKEDLYSCVSIQLKTKFTVDVTDSDRRVIKILKGGNILQLSLSRSKVQVNDSNFKGLNTSQFKTVKY